MPRAGRPCPTPGCPNLQPCTIHADRPWSRSTRKQRIGRSGWEEQAEHKAILQRDNHRCYTPFPDICTGTATQVDHIINLAAGGTDHPHNKRAICPLCHRRKTAHEAAEAHRTRQGGG